MEASSLAFPGAKTALGLRRVDGEPHGALPGVISAEMPLEQRMPDDEEGRDAVLVGGAHQPKALEMRCQGIGHLHPTKFEGPS